MPTATEIYLAQPTQEEIDDILGRRTVECSQHTRSGVRAALTM
jgi:hypothetical protein